MTVADRSEILASKGRAARVALGLALAAGALHALSWPSLATAEGLGLVTVATVEVVAVATGCAGVVLAVVSLIGRVRAHGTSGDRASRAAAIAAVVIAAVPAGVLVLDLALSPLPDY